MRIFQEITRTVVVAAMVAYCYGQNLKANPDISDSVVVWADSEALYGYDLTTETQFTIDTGLILYPRIYSTRVVYTKPKDDAGVYLYDLLSGQTSKISDEYGLGLSIDDDFVVWYDWTVEPYNLYLYNISTGSKSMLETGREHRWQFWPDISGEIVVWEDREEMYGTSDIYGYDLSTEATFAICTDDGSQCRPVIDGDRVVWLSQHDPDTGAGADGIYAYDISTDTLLQLGDGGCRDPAIHGDIAVWPKEGIMIYNFSTGEYFHVVDARTRGRKPNVEGDIVVWTDYRHGFASCWGYDLSSNEQFEIIRGLPTLSVLQPNGGESLTVGKKYSIQWSSIGFIANVVIDYSSDNGLTWTLIEPPNTGNTGIYSWVVPDVHSNHCLVRVMDANDPNVSDTSDDVFAIYSGQIFVDTHTGDDDNDGLTSETAVATIQKGIDLTAHGDTLTISPGTYTGDGNRDIDFKGKAITVKSQDGPETCIIDCQGTRDEPRRGFDFHSREDANSVLNGFTLTGSYHDYAAAINCDRSSPRIINCIMKGNTGGVMLLFRSDVCFSNSLIIGNQGKAIVCRHNDPVFLNCTIVGNRGGGLYSSSGKGKISLNNCIITGNTVPGQWLGTQVYIGGCTTQPGCMSIEIKNCCIEDDPNAIFVESWPNPSEPPIGSYIKVDPMFFRTGYWDPNSTPDNQYDDFWVAGNYHLKSQAGRWDPNSQTWVKDDVTSLCIDAGDLASPIGEEPFPNGGIINMGAYGGTAEASKSYFGKPPCETIIAGDINGDCKVDFADFSILSIHWLQQNQ